MKAVANDLEVALRKPVIDETHLKGFFDVNMKWKSSAAEESAEPKPDPAAVIDAARRRLGLQLTPARRRVEILEVNQISHRPNPAAKAQITDKPGAAKPRPNPKAAHGLKSPG